jgi:hypothetical protein
MLATNPDTSVFCPCDSWLHDDKLFIWSLLKRKPRLSCIKTYRNVGALASAVKTHSFCGGSSDAGELLMCCLNDWHPRAVRSFVARTVQLVPVCIDLSTTRCIPPDFLLITNRMIRYSPFICTVDSKGKVHPRIGHEGPWGGGGVD